MAKDTKTNAMRILDREKVSYKVNLYECDEFVDGVSVADMLGQDYEQSYKTLVLRGTCGSLQIQFSMYLNYTYVICSALASENKCLVRLLIILSEHICDTHTVYKLVAFV